PRGDLPRSAPTPEDPDEYHLSVLPHETVDALCPSSGKRLIDGTLGAGGHTFRLLTQGCEVVGFDQDPEALAVASERCVDFEDRFVAIHANFSEFGEILDETGAGKVDGVLLDLGVSSHQVDTAERGFSFQQDGPLDMRMNPDAPVSAADIVNTWNEADLKRIFWEYGEERASGKIARAIVAEREKQAFETTAQLADLIEKTCPRFGRKLHPATKVFQALRIEVNDELGVLKAGLEAAVEWLNSTGRLAVITFHSLEDRIVKHFMRDRSQQLLDRPEWPEPRPNPDYALKLINRKPIVASKAEIAANPRARSAKLRVAERI
ncbi:MAG: 16S rRNA (cytosine(1402)-N(4))-methyltransferase RsmH, partial [Verrucomicrobiota bacterium]